MAVFTINVHDSKLAYATLLKCVDLHRAAHSLKTIGLAQFFPDVADQWDDICRVLKFAVSSQIAWTGMSMTKSDSVPDDTRIPPAVEINAAIIRIMKQKAGDLEISVTGDTLSISGERKLPIEAHFYSMDRDLPIFMVKGEEFGTG